MRWRLLLVASLLATLIGAGATLAIAHVVLGSTGHLTSPGGMAAATLLIPVAACVYATIFVYRRTARRRILQAAATALLTAILTLAFIVAGAFYLSKPFTPATPAPRPNSI